MKLSITYFFPDKATQLSFYVCMITRIVCVKTQLRSD